MRKPGNKVHLWHLCKVLVASVAQMHKKISNLAATLRRLNYIRELSWAENVLRGERIKDVAQ